MASKKEDLRNFDWDDTALIKAYNKGTKLRENGYKKTTNPNKSKENVKTEDPWRVGDYCKAKYSEDQYMYEAKICSIQNGQCTVEFLGYGDKETVNLSDLKESGGKKARKRQNKNAHADYSTTSNSCLNTTDGETESNESYRGVKDLSENPLNLAPFNVSAAEKLFRSPEHLRTTPSHSRASMNHPRAAASHPHAAASHPHTAASHPHTAANPPHTAANPPHAPVNPPLASAFYMPPTIPMDLPFLPASTAPQIPQCAGLSQNPALSAMVVSWYMAGYYTGLHQGQKDSQCSQHCCGHSKRCCH